MTREIDLPAGIEPGSPEALEHMLAQVPDGIKNPIHQGTEPETPPVLPGSSPEEWEMLILGLEMVLDAVKEMRDNV